MDFTLSDMLKAVGPSASLIFAAWIFLTFLQSRYSAAFEKYRTLIEQYRGADPTSKRRSSLKDQILLYKERCELMRRATTVGVAAAVCLIVGLMIGTLGTMFPDSAVVKYAGVACILIGLALVIAAAIPVIRENLLIQHALESEVSDIPELSKATGQAHTAREPSAAHQA